MVSDILIFLVYFNPSKKEKEEEEEEEKASILQVLLLIKKFLGGFCIENKAKLHNITLNPIAIKKKINRNLNITYP